MTTTNYILAIDQGTTSTKALVIDADGQVVGSSSPDHFPIAASYPRAGWVEFDPGQMFESVCQSARSAVRNAGLAFNDLAAVGLANQGETVIAFDGEDGHPLYPAISWQDRRGETIVEAWQASEVEAMILAKTGLRLDPYFSAPKLAWVMKNVPQSGRQLASGRLRLGTSDAWLIWQLTGGKCFVTDSATASRTMLCDLASLAWCAELLDLFEIPASALPHIVPNAGVVGVTCREVFGVEIPIAGICVDQQAALFGQRGFVEGDTKITYGTGCFVLTNVGHDAARRAAGLLTSVGWQIRAATTFVLDGGVYSAGSLVDWLCQLGLARDAVEISQLASEVKASPVMLIPAFNGLAAPRWSGDARACWVGMDATTDRRHLVRSSLEAIAFCVGEIFESMRASGLQARRVSVDGGLTRSDVLMQLQADVLGIPLMRSSMSEFTALGAGYLAGLGCGMWRSVDQLAFPDGETTIFEPDGAAGKTYAEVFEKWKAVCSSVVAIGEAGQFRPIAESSARA